MRCFRAKEGDMAPESPCKPEFRLETALLVLVSCRIHMVKSDTRQIGSVSGIIYIARCVELR